MITKSNKVSSYIYVYFYISIFCILNGGLFSYLTANTPFSYWRQFFTLLGFCLLFRASHFMYSSQLIRMQKYMLFIIYVLILCLFVYRFKFNKDWLFFLALYISISYGFIARNKLHVW